MRILHIVPSLTGGGAERHVVDLLSHLQAPGMQAAALSVYAPGIDEEEKARLTFLVMQAGRKRRSDYAFLHHLVGTIREFRPDIVHTHTHVGKYWGRAAALLAGVRTIVHTEHSPCDPLRGRFEPFIDPLLQRCTARVVTFFSEQRLALSRRDGIPLDKIVTIPNGLALADEPPPEPRDNGRALLRDRLNMERATYAVVMAGRLQYPKNQQLALHALSEMDSAARHSLHLYVVGSGTDELPLRELAKSLDVAKHVSFMGHRSDVRDILRACDLVLMPSLYEGMPLVLIEAMLSRAPVLTTPWIGAHEMLGYGRFGFITAGWDPRILARDILRALASASIRHRLAELAAAHARERFGIRQMIQSYESLYSSLQVASCA